jgi:DNA-binding NarL/FixJ family response regulator
MPANPTFSDLEIALLRMVCNGSSREDIAGELKISRSTVKTIITGILNKTGFENIMKFAVYAVANGFIAPHVNSGNR